ncbi:hypothetical protein LZD49_35080 [Dyadobacter sp. CY261]|nr:hypothetical protein [Dyadobacter sp. CY261]MCF0075748.1 hypothetical protein [Dyadobacter sp. CY261]
MIKAALRVFSIYPVNRATARTHKTVAALFTVVGLNFFVMGTKVDHINQIELIIKDRKCRPCMLAEMDMTILESAIDVNCTSRKSRRAGLKPKPVWFQVAKLEMSGKLPATLHRLLHDCEGM